jgi:hypothetical protein
MSFCLDFNFNNSVVKEKPDKKNGRTSDPAAGMKI